MSLLATVMLLLSLPHWFYAFVWTRPGKFCKFLRGIGFTADPVDAFAGVAVVLKLVQACAIGIRLWSVGEWPSPPLAMLAAGFVMLATGQFLNASIYKAIGKVGVYYGCRLGHDVPWCTGFPFNTVSHPQYVGSVLSFAGGLALVHSPASVAAGVWYIAAWMAGLYTMTGVIESYADAVDMADVPKQHKA